MRPPRQAPAVTRLPCGGGPKRHRETRTGVLYRSIDAAVVRAAVSSKAAGLPPWWPDLTGHSAEHRRQWRDWLRAVWADEALAEAVTGASPTLAAAVEDICGGRVDQPRRIRKATQSLVGYVLRMTTRATPFGLFAGVGPAALGGRAAVVWGETHGAVARPDARWLSELITALQSKPGVLRAVPVVTNTLAFERGDRLVIPCQPHLNQDGEDSPADIAVRYNQPVQEVVKATRSPILTDDLIAKLTVEFPDADEQVIEAMIVKLVASGVLITSLRPPMDATDPLGHLIDQLAAASRRRAVPAINALAMVRRSLVQYATASSHQARRAAATAAATQMAALHDRPGPPLATDLRLDCEIVLPPAVIAEAETAASALARLTPHPHGNPAWQAWHALYIERYGPGAVVPVPEIVDADRGLGYPAGYRGSPHPSPGPTPAQSVRDQAWLRLAQRAVLDGSEEVVLDEATLTKLAPTFDIDATRGSSTRGSSAHRAPHLVPHTELRFSLHAATPKALDHGEFTLVVMNVTRQAGTSIGRFLHLFSDPVGGRIAEAFSGLPPLTAGAITVQVSCPPLSTRAQNLVRTPGLFPLISLAEHRSPSDPARDRAHGGGQIALDDLAVTGDAHRLFVVRMSTGQIVEPLMMNALEFRHGTHPMARFLCEITTARAAACLPFSWGAAAGQPFLPRVRYRRSVLRTARWNLNAADLPGPQASWPTWEQAWEKLRRTYRIPRRVFVGELDVVIGVDLEEPTHRALLRAQVDRAGAAALTEAPDDQAYGWFGGRPHEIALPLARIPLPEVPPPALRRSKPLKTARHTGHLPGASRWLYARLYGHPDRQTELLTVHLPGLLAAWPYHDPDMWFVRHHRDPHLRVRLHLADADDYGHAARHLGKWAARLHQAGLLNRLILDIYHPEIGRYGTGPALEAVETVFAADSAAAIAQLTITTSGPGLHPQAITAASFVDLAIAFTGNRDSGLRWLVDHVAHQGGTAIARELREQAMRLTVAGDEQFAGQADAGQERMTRTWARRRQAVGAYRDRLNGVNGPDPDRVLASLLHMHHTRMIGIDDDSERVCLRLARAVAMSWSARTPGADHPRSTSR
jgi:thiopeptide-type bacteriocin biosynthesis protein